MNKMPSRNPLCNPPYNQPRNPQRNPQHNQSQAKNQPEVTGKRPERHYYPTKVQEIALECTCQTILFGGARGGGKCLSINDLCITPFGERRMGDLKVGDIISDTEGSVQKVTGVYFNGLKDMYRVKFIDGASVRCTEDHLWNVKITCKRSKKRKYVKNGENPQDYDWRVIPFRDIKAWLDKKEAAPEGATIKFQNMLIPLCKPVRFTKSYKVNMRPIDPYILGLLIGDGCISDKIKYVTFSSLDNELPEYIKSKGYDIRRSGNSEKDYVIYDAQLIDDLKKLNIYGNLSDTHFIPQSYKLGTIEDRISLIQGLFDTDGTADERGHVSYCTTSKQLALDVQWIIRSLGGKATITESPGWYKDAYGNRIDCKMSYVVYVNTDINKKLFRLKRKIDRCKDEFNGGVGDRHRRIVGYEYIGKEQCVCITVTHPNSLYLTNDFIVTHNSHACRFKIMQHAQLYGTNARMIFMRRSLRELEQFIDNCKVMFKDIAIWKEQKKRFEFKNGAVCDFNYLEGESVHNYQGQEFTLIILDEVGQFDSYDDIKLLKGCLRSASGVPCQLFMTCNPGGRLHNILKSEFIDPAPKGMIPIPDLDPFTQEPLGTWRVYIPALLSDNPHLLENDPTYVQRLKQVGSPEMVRAWLKGDWNVIAGGAFDKLFDRDIHVIKPFRIPLTWSVIECYDDGLTRPAAALWFAISDGTDYYLPNGERRSSIRGDIFVIGELYFWTGKPNEGSAESIQAKAEKIKRKEKILGYEISQRIADSAIFSSKTSSYADEFAENGVYFDRCNKAPGTRIQAANLFRARLMGALERDEKPGIFFFSTCVNSIRTIPTLPRDKQNPDDIDSKSEDHCLHGDTIIHTAEYGHVPIRELVGLEGHCMTAGGYYAKFSNCKCFQQDTEMMEIITDGGESVVCTKDHEILTENNGFQKAEMWLSEKFASENRISFVNNTAGFYCDQFVNHIDLPTDVYAVSDEKEKALKATQYCMENPADGRCVLYRSVKKASVLKERSDAYCLTTDITHSIVVNDGFVVSNCYDCICYLLLSGYDSEVKIYSAGNI